MDKKIFVYEEFFGRTELIGYLYIDRIRSTERHSFEFSNLWLKEHRFNFMIDPDLAYIPGRQYPVNKAAFGIFSDSCPDRWGRVLMDRRERIVADMELRKPDKLNDGDYLLGVYDESRMGAVRFKLDECGDFLSSDSETTIPPWTTIRTLEEAARNFESEETTLQAKWLNHLIKPGSSLGGSRPKATVSDPNGNLWIAKFPSRKDEYDVGAWEKTAHDLAKQCGLNSPETKLEAFSKYGSTFLIKRFDRDCDKRIHFASAMTLLGKTGGQSEECSYLDIVSFIKSNSASPKEDLRELWKRIVFNMAITNSDDHLRNHGFILTTKGWVLSPLYDINPVPYGNCLSLTVAGISNEISIENAIATAKYYGIAVKEAEETAEFILHTIETNWEKTALSNKLTRAAVEYMRPAFCR